MRVLMNKMCLWCEYIESMNGEYLRCKKNAPTAGQDGKAVWPIVEQNDSCEEFKARDVWTPVKFWSKEEKR